LFSQEEKLQEIKQRHIEETVKNIAQTEIGKKVLSKMDEKEIAELDTDKIMMKQVIISIIIRINSTLTLIMQSKYSINKRGDNIVEMSRLLKCKFVLTNRLKSWRTRNVN